MITMEPPFDLVLPWELGGLPSSRQALIVSLIIARHQPVAMSHRRRSGRSGFEKGPCHTDDALGGALTDVPLHGEFRR